MDRSLTVLLPVHNAQSTLRQTVQETLDVLPDVSRQFEILIIDEGSTDATSEVAAELAYRYPQVHFAYRSQIHEDETAIRVGMELSKSEIVLVRDDQEGTPLQSLPLGEMRRQDAAQPSGAQGLTGGIRQRLEQYVRRSPKYRIVCQRSRDTVEMSSAPSARPNYLASLKKFSRGE